MTEPKFCDLRTDQEKPIHDDKEPCPLGNAFDLGSTARKVPLPNGQLLALASIAGAHIRVLGFRSHQLAAPQRRSRCAPRSGSGGASRDRTDDLKLAKLALSQLSYGPDRKEWWARKDLNLRPHAYQACALTS